MVRSLEGKGYSTRLIAGHFAQRGVSVSHHAIARTLRRLREDAPAVRQHDRQLGGEPRRRAHISHAQRCARTVKVPTDEADGTQAGVGGWIEKSALRFVHVKCPHGCKIRLLGLQVDKVTPLGRAARVRLTEYSLHPNASLLARSPRPSCGCGSQSKGRNCKNGGKSQHTSPSSDLLPAKA